MAVKIFIGSMLLLIVALSGCASSARLDCRWRESPVIVDGDAGEWSIAFVEDARMSVGVQNDAERLYLCLVSADPAVQAQLLRPGLIVWLDGEGKKEKRFGIRYPAGDFASDGPGGGARDRARVAAPSEKERREQRAKRIDELRDRVCFISSATSDGWTMNRSEFRGVEVDVQFDGSRLVYELSVPLRSGEGRPYALNVSPAGRIMIGLETRELDRGEMPGPVGGGMMGGMGGGMGGGRGGMEGPPGGGRPGGTRGERPEPIKAWIEVDLSSLQ